jgi:hypothetical protein
LVGFLIIALRIPGGNDQRDAGPGRTAGHARSSQVTEHQFTIESSDYFLSTFHMFFHSKCLDLAPLSRQLDLCLLVTSFLAYFIGFFVSICPF